MHHFLLCPPVPLAGECWSADALHLSSAGGLLAADQRGLPPSAWEATVGGVCPSLGCGLVYVEPPAFRSPCLWRACHSHLVEKCFMRQNS